MWAGASPASSSLPSPSCRSSVDRRVRSRAVSADVPYAFAREALGVRAGGWAGVVAFKEHPVLLDVLRDLSARVCGPLDEAA